MSVSTLLLAVRKKDLWPPKCEADHYAEDDLFDVIEYLFLQVSKPLHGTYHDYSDCGMHWSTFDKSAGQKIYRDKMNAVLRHYEHRFELSANGDVLMEPDQGFTEFSKAELPTHDQSVIGRMNAATVKFRRHGSKH